MKFRKKPIVIDAIQWTGKNFDEVLEFLGEHCSNYYADHKTIFIDTLEGTMAATKNSWIIRGIKGEYYPCQPDVFKKTYEKVEDE